MAHLFLATGATGVFRAAIGMAAAPQRGANPSFATEGFRAATGVAAAPQRGANPPFATGAGSGEAASLLCNSERGEGGFGILTGHFGSKNVVALASSLLDKGGARRTQSRSERAANAEPNLFELC